MTRIIYKDPVRRTPDIRN